MPARSRSAEAQGVRRSLAEVKAEHERKQMRKALTLLGYMEKLVDDATTERPFFGYDDVGYVEEALTEDGEKALAAILAALNSDPF